MSTARDIDIAVIGSTGFTGRLISEYLTNRPGGAVVALTGRSQPKVCEYTSPDLTQGKSM